MGIFHRLGSLWGLILVVSLVWVLSIWVFQIKVSSNFNDAIGNNSLPSLFDVMPATRKTQKSLGWKVVERSYRRSWRDLTTTICPILRHPNKTQPPPSSDFYTTCLQKATELGNKEGTPYQRKWPWWFNTLLRDVAKKYNGLQGPWHVLQFSNPDLRLCVYEKGGTKAFKRLHCQHIHNYTDSIPDFNQCFQYQPKYKNLPESDKAVFLRDPLDRFLSGFIDKCINHRDVVDHCEPITVFHNQSTSPVTNLMVDKRKFFEMYVDTMPLQWNMHFMPQSMNCGGLYRDIDQYKFVGSMGRGFYADLNRLIQLYPALESGIEKTFKLSRMIQSQTTNERGIETGAAGQVLDYYTPHTARRVLEYYAIDYMLLRLPIPEWAEDLLRQEED